MTTDLSVSNESLVEEINIRQHVIESGKNAVQEAALMSANAIREAGIYLIQLKEQTKHGEWLGLFEGRSNSKPILNLTDQTARNYMRFAKANPEPFTTPAQAIGAYKEIYKTTGLIESGDTTAGAKQLTPVDGWLTKILDAVASINRVVDKHNLNEAPQTVKDVFVERARPVVKLFFDAGGQL